MSKLRVVLGLISICSWACGGGDTLEGETLEGDAPGSAEPAGNAPPSAGPLPKKVNERPKDDHPSGGSTPESSNTNWIPVHTASPLVQLWRELGPNLGGPHVVGPQPELSQSSDLRDAAEQREGQASDPSNSGDGNSGSDDSDPGDY
jgi:hypothetical protein